jgi:hypothetical protein
VQAKAHDFAAALETAEEIEDAYRRAETLTEIAIMQVQAGEREAARDMFATAFSTIYAIVPGPGDREEDARGVALRDIVAAQVRVGEFVAALENAWAIDVEGFRWMALEAVAGAHARAGNFAAALEIAQSIKSARGRAGALNTIALEQERSGEQNAARATFATSLAAACEVKEERSRSRILETIAHRQIYERKLIAARESAQMVEDGQERARLLSALAQEQAKAGMGAEAVRTAEAFLLDRSEHLFPVAAALADVRDKEYFKHLLIPCAYGLDLAYNMCGLLARVYPEQAIAISQIVAGEGKSQET